MTAGKIQHEIKKQLAEEGRRERERKKEKERKKERMEGPCYLDYLSPVLDPFCPPEVVSREQNSQLYSTLDLENRKCRLLSTREYQHLAHYRIHASTWLIIGYIPAPTVAHYRIQPSTWLIIRYIPASGSIQDTYQHLAHYRIHTSTWLIIGYSPAPGSL